MSAARRLGIALSWALILAGLGSAIWRAAQVWNAASDNERAAQVTAQLEALGYVAEVSHELDATRRGVLLHDATRASPGVNVYCSVRDNRARFLDMEGHELHSIALNDAGDGADCMLEPYGERSFLALAWPTLSLLDFEGRVAWKSREGEHHDVAVDAEGRVWTLLQEGDTLRKRSRALPIVGHFLARLGPDGRVEWQLPLAALFANAVPDERFDHMARTLERFGLTSEEYGIESDVFHFNTVEVLDRDLAVAQRGDVLLSARELDLVAIVDPEVPSVVWSWGPGELDEPHHPSVLPNGNLLIFDNGNRRGWSRLVELEPATGTIVWQYHGEPPKSFWSPVRGSAQALPNGNILVTGSTRGRVFEITRDGDIVWEFRNPDFRDGHRQQIYRMQRVSLERYAAWAGSAEQSTP